MKFAVEVQAENAEALGMLVSATERLFESLGATILESVRHDEDCTAFAKEGK